MKKHSFSPVVPVLLIWAVLTAAAWFGPDRAQSEAERRPLAQRPGITLQALESGKYMTAFETYSLDQFPLRDTFRQIKALFHNYVLLQKDNNGIYVSGGYAAQQLYPLDEASLAHALDRFGMIYETYLEPAGSRVWMATVPDKGYYLAQTCGQLSMDYDAMFRRIREGMPWAEHVDLTGSLELEDYYRTDTHWRQEKLPETAAVLCEAMDIPAPGDFTLTVLERPFYGVYYGQAALPMEPEDLCVLENDLLRGCTVYDHESGKEYPVYNLDMLWNRDPYDVFLSGSRSLLTVRNPEGQPGKELIVFRDSFGSSLVPLLLQGYSQVTLVDIRYLQPGLLDRYIDFHGQDVLFLYSTLILNNSETIK